MNHTQRFALRTTAVAALVCLAAGVQAAPTIDANIEFDNTWLNNDRGLNQSGRVEMNVASKVGSNYFVAGRASYMAFRNGTAGVDDMWVQFGNSMVDVKLGRFEAADMFALPRDAIVLYAGGGGAVYRAQTLRGRTPGTIVNEGGADAGDVESPWHGALTFNAGGGLAVEVGAIKTNDRDTNQGFRPVLTYTGGPLTVKAAIERIEWARTAVGADRNTETGFGLSGKYDLGSVAFLAHYAQIKDPFGNKAKTLGLVVDTPTPGFTVGLIFAKNGTDGGEDYKVQTGYAAYTMPLFDVKGATITAAGSISKAKGSNEADDEKGVKLRINYTF